MSGTDAHAQTAGDSAGPAPDDPNDHAAPVERHEVREPERVIVSSLDMHFSDEDKTSEQTAHAYETSQAEGERTND
ncbi:hypothetical protein [Yinghuangia soli]|uniref:Uncharacterized protein n=1 Tax=Yinghuangia soli TaxID=2908204 RepID=A0AA41Q9N7_9ACTN|nr:hypothetical protein [Yinghuangia soli]MCF2533842.1 hypothetical protein [Yinghuangia soli]